MQDQKTKISHDSCDRDHLQSIVNDLCRKCLQYSHIHDASYISSLSLSICQSSASYLSTSSVSIALSEQNRVIDENHKQER